MNVEPWLQTAYIKGAVHKLQSKGFTLKGTTLAPTKIEAKTAEFRTAGRGEAKPLSTTFEPGQLMNAARDKVTLTLEDWQAMDPIKHPDVNRMNTAELDVVQTTCAYALGRVFDNMHFLKMDAAAGAIATIGDGSAQIQLLDPMGAKSDIVGAGLLTTPDIFCPLPAYAFQKMKIYKQFSESTWKGGDLPLARGAEAVTWDGVHYFQAPNELFTYDTGRSATAWKTATWFQTYMWHRAALGFATSYTMQSRITWENLYTSWLANNWMDGGVAIIEADAIKRIKMLFTKPATLPT